ncbi:hypothetical protein DBR40_08545 [Pedobacter sp. KBW01]|nr:hypothetical protein DBR40_08545 [Pedobacter sp. KBW01]
MDTGPPTILTAEHIDECAKGTEQGAGCFPQITQITAERICWNYLRTPDFRLLTAEHTEECAKGTERGAGFFLQKGFVRIIFGPPTPDF